MTKFVIVLLVLVAASLSQVIDYRDCPNVEVVQDFNLTAYIGVWYIFSRYWDFGRTDTRCNNVTYSLRPNGSIDVLDQNIYIVTEKHQKRKGIANLLGDGTEGIFDFTYPPTKGIVGEYLVLGTDYDNWAVVWSCLGIDTVGSVRNAWLYSRNINPIKEVVNATKTVLQQYGIPIDILITESQEDCGVV